MITEIIMYNLGITIYLLYNTIYFIFLNLFDIICKINNSNTSLEFFFHVDLQLF